MNIFIVTTSRADYSPLTALIDNIINENNMKLTVVSVMIDLKNNFFINKNLSKKVKFILHDLGSKNLSINNHFTKVLNKLSVIFSKNKIDLIIILGDRYELLAVPIAAIEKLIPVMHIAGGHVTQGSFDESIRHAVTKLSHLHIASSLDNYKNIISLKEEKWRIKLAGSLGAENTKNIKFLSSKEILSEYGLDTNLPYALIALHPTTNNRNLKNNIKVFIRCLHKLNLQYIITYPNNDPESDIIIKQFKMFVKKVNHDNKKRAVFVKNLGTVKYLSIMKNCKILLGNSSSAIIESPTFRIPVINIGDRQKGRKISKNIINTKFNEKEIDKKIKLALSKNFISKKNFKNPYYIKNTSLKIINFINFIFKHKNLKEIITKKNKLIHD